MTVEKAPKSETVVLLGATGHLGGKVARNAIRRGYRVRALVRPSSDSSALVSMGVEVVRGDLLDRRSLDRALEGSGSVIATAIGYANRKKGDIASATDTTGNRHLAEAAVSVGIRRLVYCSVLTCDQAKDVPHFWNKKLAEDAFEERGVPFIALRPGAFLDQGPNDFWASGLRKGRLTFAANPNVPATFVHTDDVARLLVEALDLASTENALRIDVGCDRAVSIVELASIMAVALDRPIRPQVPPWPLVSTALRVAGVFDPWKRDLRAMMAYFQGGTYVANTAVQSRLFGPPPRIEDAVRLYLEDVGLLAGPSSAHESHPREVPT